jgi:hypothetical protein
MTTERDLIQRMADELDHYRQLLADNRHETCALANEARSFLALAQPEPPSLKEQALADFDDWLVGRTLGRPEADERSERIRRALE